MDSSGKLGRYLVSSEDHQKYGAYYAIKILCNNNETEKVDSYNGQCSWHDVLYPRKIVGGNVL